MEIRGASSSDSSSKAGPSANGTSTAASLPPPFLSKTYDMVDDPASDAIVSWGALNNSFVVWNPPEFARDLLPKYFKHNNFSSFVRQLNTYGFRKVDPDKWEFANEGFLRGQKHLLKNISRRKPSHAQSQPTPPPPQKGPVSACVEVGKFGLEEEIEQLKRDKNILMQELVRLRQQQQTSDHQLNTLNERLHGMEQRQQQMMSFLAKAMQSPGFLAQLVQQTDPNRRLTAGNNKKRRFPKQEQEPGVVNGESSSSSSSSSSAAAPDGQIIKYQPLINEAAKSMVLQMLNLDIPSDNFLFDNFSNQLEKNNVNLARRNSGVTLKEMSCLPSTSADVMDMFNQTISQDFNQAQAAPQDFTKQLAQTPSVVVNEDLTHKEPGMQDLSEYQEMAANAEPVNIDDSLLDIDAITGSFDYLDDIENLPSIGDPFWEQLLQSPAADANGDEMQENDDMITGENGWDKLQNMENLTEQMGHLSSENKNI